MSLKYYDTNLLTNIADAIRQQEGTNNLMTVESMPNHIENIPTGGSFKYMSFAEYPNFYINDEDIDFDVNKAYATMEGRLFYNCRNLKSIPNSINIHNFSNLSNALFRTAIFNIYDIAGDYPNLVNGSNFYWVNYVKDSLRPAVGNMNVHFNLPKAEDLSYFLHIENQQAIQPGQNWVLDIQAPNAKVYDTTVYISEGSFFYTNNTNVQWNLTLNMPNLTKFSNFFTGFKIFNIASANSWNKLYTILNNLTANVTDASCMFTFFNCGSNGKLPNINTAKFTNVFNMFYGCNISTAAKFSNFNNWDLNNVINADQMFYSVGNLLNVATLNLYMENCVSANYFFGYWYGTHTRHVINLPNCKYASRMFANCMNMTVFPNVYLPNLEDCSSFFNGSRNIKDIPEGFITSNKVTNMDSMFAYCNNLTNESLVNIAKWIVTLNLQNQTSYPNIKALDGYYSYRVINNLTGDSYYKYQYGPLYGSNKKINTATVGSDLVNQLREAGWTVS